MAGGQAGHGRDLCRGRRTWPRAAARPISDKRGTTEYRKHLAGVLTAAHTGHRRRAGPRQAQSRQTPESTAGDFRPIERTTSVSRGITRTSVVQKTHVTTTINGEPVEFLCEARQSLLEVLRDTLGLTGSKEGCNNGNCGACTVLLDGQPVDSCLVLGVEAEGAADHHDRRSGPRVALAPDPAVFPGRRGAAVRHLHAGLHHDGQGPARTATRTPANTRSAFNWPAICAAAPATTRSCGPCRTRPRGWPAKLNAGSQTNGPLRRQRQAQATYGVSRETKSQASTNLSTELARWLSRRTHKTETARQAIQSHRHAADPARRRRQGDRPRRVRRRRATSGTGVRPHPAQPARARQDQVDRHLGRREAAGRGGRGHGRRLARL